jgi:hypothetical protein
VVGTAREERAFAHPTIPLPPSPTRGKGTVMRIVLVAR